MIRKSAYSAFNAVPWKLIRAENVFMGNKISPLHIRIMVTNKCNASCEWCCYKDVDRKEELSIKELKDIIDYFYVIGTRAITFSGGGEPTIHPQVDEMLMHAKDKGIDCGIVTNGILWCKKGLDLEIPNKALTWARISVIETLGNYNTNMIINFAENLKDVDIGISFVAPKGANVALAADICKIANEFSNITHVKFIQDSYTLEDKVLQGIEAVCAPISKKAFFIWRNEFTEGRKDCHISLLKPVVDATGYVYPCCDVQHSIGVDTRHPPENFRMCYWEDFAGVERFDGSICKKCYYDMYNMFLDEMIKKTDHDSFL